eukprot:TRINITY_DN11666_c0_g1_i1.p1 TRINITY_DN11666_c0_g1~~TRINITY_DN11666_c0_g1_i1.p1  ORF type:complete len:375 (+),score=86.21 TRINITY_DN11666_c0_g1_i1:124-1248(+)
MVFWKKVLRVDRLLSNINVCERKEVGRLLAQRRVRYKGEIVTRLGTKVRPEEVTVDDKPIDNSFLKCISIALHKPRGYVCSASGRDGQSIYELLPESFAKVKPHLSMAGRLDKWASGLVIMSQDGKLVDRIIDPPEDGVVPKTYEVKLEQPLKGDEAKTFASGEIMLHNETKPLKPVRLEEIDPTQNLIRITLFEGRYHQIRRMLAVVGNQALTIHRIAVGPVQLKDLPQGHWRALTDDEIKQLSSSRLSKAAKSVWQPLRSLKSSSPSSTSSSTSPPATNNPSAKASSPTSPFTQPQSQQQSEQKKTKKNEKTEGGSDSKKSKENSRTASMTSPRTPKRSSPASTDLDPSKQKVTTSGRKMLVRSRSSKAITK